MPSADCEPIERRPRPDLTRRWSRLCEMSWRRLPTAGPAIEHSSSTGIPASWPTVMIPCSRRRFAVAGPTPQSASTGSGCKNDNSVSGDTTNNPSGFAALLATFARCLVVATPIDNGRPTSSRTRARSRAAISGGVPANRSIPRTSRNASSIDSGSTTGAVSRKIRNTSRDASTYALNRGDTTIASGHRFLAFVPPIADLTPNARAS